MPSNDWEKAGMPRPAPEAYKQQVKRETIHDRKVDKWIKSREVELAGDAKRLKKGKRFKHGERIANAEKAAKLKSVLAEEPLIAEACERASFALRVSMMKPNRHTSIPHWHFHVGQDVVFHWWPSKGSWRNPLNEAKGTETDPWCVFRLACKAAEDRIRQSQHLASI